MSEYKLLEIEHKSEVIRRKRRRLEEKDKENNERIRIRLNQIINEMHTKFEQLSVYRCEFILENVSSWNTLLLHFLIELDLKEYFLILIHSGGNKKLIIFLNNPDYSEIQGETILLTNCSNITRINTNIGFHA